MTVETVDRAHEYDRQTDRIELARAEKERLEEEIAARRTRIRELDQVIGIERTQRLPRRPRPVSDLDPHVQAGHAAPDMLKVFQKHGEPMRVADAAAKAKVGSGTSTWAIRALVKDGLIEPTGERINRSHVYRLTRRGRTTRLRPGE